MNIITNAGFEKIRIFFWPNSEFTSIHHLRLYFCMMHQKLKIQNTLGGQLEEFMPQHPPFVGMYLCGPTVYGDPHLGHSRGPIVFDVVRRYLMHIGYKVRFVRNITDVGHLVNDADEGEDKIQKKARLEQLEPMEVAQHYTDAYNDNIQKLNVLRPSVEPKASGHIIEQIEMIEKIMAAGLAYEVNGSVYFDVLKYASTNKYGEFCQRFCPLESSRPESFNAMVVALGQRISRLAYRMFGHVGQIFGRIVRYSCRWNGFVISPSRS